VSLTRQIVTRVPDNLYEALERDASSHGRTLAQSVRWHLLQSLGVAEPIPTQPPKPKRPPRPGRPVPATHEHSFRREQGSSGTLVDVCTVAGCEERR
jgi:hypothetical protein